MNNNSHVGYRKLAIHDAFPLYLFSEAIRIGSFSNCTAR